MPIITINYTNIKSTTTNKTMMITGHVPQIIMLHSLSVLFPYAENSLLDTAPGETKFFYNC